MSATRAPSLEARSNRLHTEITSLHHLLRHPYDLFRFVRRNIADRRLASGHDYCATKLRSRSLSTRRRYFDAVAVLTPARSAIALILAAGNSSSTARMRSSA